MANSTMNRWRYRVVETSGAGDQVSVGTILVDSTTGHTDPGETRQWDLFNMDRHEVTGWIVAEAIEPYVEDECGAPMTEVKP